MELAITTLLLYLALAFLFQVFVIYIAVRWALSPSYNSKLLRIQADLLARIARKQGVSEEEIAASFSLD